MAEEKNNRNFKEKETPFIEEKVQGKEVEKEREVVLEKKIIEEKIKRELEKLKSLKFSPTEDEEKEIKEKAEKIKKFGQKEKLKKLLNIAHQRGLPFAVKVAQATGDEYLLDLFHDILVHEGLYKKFIK